MSSSQACGAGSIPLPRRLNQRVRQFYTLEGACKYLAAAAERDVFLAIAGQLDQDI